MSGVPGIVTATFESMVALKATLMLSEIKRYLLCNKTLQYVYTSFLFVCIYHQFDLFPESSRTLLFSVLTPCHKWFILKKVSSSISYMSLAAQRQPHWQLSAIAVPLVTCQGLLPFDWKGWVGGNVPRSRSMREFNMEAGCV